MDGYKVVTDAIQTEVKWWNLRADHMAQIAETVAGASLGEPAFFFGDPVTLAITALLDAKPEAEAYENFRAWFQRSLDEAVHQFTGIAKVLQQTAHDYDEAEDVIHINLDKAYEV